MVLRGVVHLEYVKVCLVPSTHGSQIHMKRAALFRCLQMKLGTSRLSFSFCLICVIIDKLWFVLLFNGISRFHSGMFRTHMHVWSYDNVLSAISTMRFLPMSEGIV